MKRAGRKRIFPAKKQRPTNWLLTPSCSLTVYMKPRQYRDNNLVQIFVDSSYNWKDTVNNSGTGKICVAIPRRNYLEKIEVTISVPGIKQLNNRFELLAVRIGLDTAKRLKIKKFIVFSDSRTAVAWAKHPQVRWVKREENVAGWEFEKRI